MAKVPTEVQTEYNRRSLAKRRARGGKRVSPKQFWVPVGWEDDAREYVNLAVERAIRKFRKENGLEKV